MIFSVCEHTFGNLEKLLYQLTNCEIRWQFWFLLGLQVWKHAIQQAIQIWITFLRHILYRLFRIYRPLLEYLPQTSWKLRYVLFLLAANQSKLGFFCKEWLEKITLKRSISDRWGIQVYSDIQFETNKVFFQH